MALPISQEYLAIALQDGYAAQDTILVHRHVTELLYATYAGFDTDGVVSAVVTDFAIVPWEV